MFWPSLHHYKLFTQYRMTTHEVMINTPSLIRFRAVMAFALRANSIIPSPVGFPRSSTTTTARSISPKIPNASDSISLEMCGDRYLTRNAAPCAANRTRNGRPRCMCPSIAARAFSAWWRVSLKHTTLMWYHNISIYPHSTVTKKYHMQHLYKLKLVRLSTTTSKRHPKTFKKIQLSIHLSLTMILTTGLTVGGAVQTLLNYCYYYVQTWQLWLVHTANTDKTRLSCLVLSVFAVWTELATRRDCLQLKIPKQFCPVSKCGVNWILSCPGPVFSSQCGYLLWRHIWKLGQD